MGWSGGTGEFPLIVIIQSICVMKQTVTEKKVSATEEDAAVESQEEKGSNNSQVNRMIRTRKIPSWMKDHVR